MSTEDRAGVEVTTTEIAGIPAFTADLLPGLGVRTSAALQFRVGRADESLARFGITHLVEHLAMFAVGDVTFQANGMVDDTRTIFHAAGDPDEVGGFLRRTVEALGALPLERLELEKRVLQTESDSNPPSVISRLLAGRFGSRTYGLSQYRELGLQTATEDDVRNWASERFTRGNAAVWIAGEVPDGLDLDLPEGRRFSPPSTDPLPRLELPLYIEEGTGGAAAGFMVQRLYSSTIAMGIALDQLRHSLRVDRAVSYAPTGSYIPLTGHVAHATLSADALEENVVQVRDEILRIVSELAEAGPTEEQLSREKQLAEKALDTYVDVPGRLDAMALAELMGVPPPSDEELRAELAAVDAGAVTERMGEARASMVLIAPAGLPPAEAAGLTWGGRHTPPVEGRRFRHRRRGVYRPRAELILAEEGITLVDPDFGPLTVLFDEVDAVETRAPGTLVLNAADESAIQLSPAALRHGEEVEAAIRAAIPDWKFLPPPDA